MIKGLYLQTMKIRRQNIWGWLAVWLIMGLSCQSHPGMEKLSQVESMIWNMPDSAYQIMSKLTLASFEKESEKAKYALLMTQASVHTNRPILSDSLINVAMNYYYSEPNTPDYALSCLYRGNVLEYLGREEEALDMYLSANNVLENLADRRIYYWVYTSLGNFYARFHIYREAVKYYELALSLNLSNPFLEKTDTPIPFKGIIRLYPNLNRDTWETLLNDRVEKIQLTDSSFQKRRILKPIDEANIDSKQKTIQEIINKHILSSLKSENYGLKKQGIITLLSTITIILVLMLILYEGWKFYKKKQLIILQQYRKDVADLQQQIDDLQERETENQLLEQQLRCLEVEKQKKELRVRQLEVIFHAKEITLSVDLIEAAQVYIRIMDKENPIYIPAENRYKLERWLNVTCNQFANRLSEHFPSLTNGEKDICYLFALNLSFKDVAKVLNIQTRSVERSVCRICQRMELPQSGKEEFLNIIRDLKELD